MNINLNRSTLSEQLKHVFKNAQQIGEGLTVIMCDVDNFKMINDRF